MAAMTIRAMYLGEMMYRQKVKTMQSTMPYKSLTLPATTGMVAMDKRKKMLAMKVLMRMEDSIQEKIS